MFCCPQPLRLSIAAKRCEEYWTRLMDDLENSLLSGNYSDWDVHSKLMCHCFGLGQVI